MRALLTTLLLVITTTCHAGETIVTLNGSRFDVELAITESEHSHGLMGKTALKQNQGMLFVYDEPKQLTFWMKETLIPLDILFFDATGKLLEVFANTPPCKKEPCETYTNHSPAQYVLELTAGSARRLRLKAGDNFTLPQQ